MYKYESTLKGVIYLGIRIRRWLFFIITVTTALFLCWQDSGGSTELTLKICGAIINLFSKIGFKIGFTTNFYYVVRKLGHFIAFILLAISSYLVANSTIKNLRTAIVLPIIIDVVIVLATECIQAFLPGRIFSAMDLYIDTMGVLVGATISMWVINNAL